ncbi:hypothetical protein AAC387_Pa04g1894 [Persea americana]
MTPSSSLFKTPTQTSFPLIPSISPFFLSTSHLSFSSLPPFKPHHFSPLILSKQHPLSPPLSSSYQEDGLPAAEEEEEEEHVIGDCLVFEEGVFEDPYLQIGLEENPTKKNPTRKKKPKPVQEESLVPDEWKEAQTNLHMSKKEKRAILQQLEFGRKVERKLNPVVLPNMADYSSYRSLKLSQLNPVVLDNPGQLKTEKRREEATGSESSDRDVGEFDGGELGRDSSSRVVPRNPRLRVGGRGLKDVSEFFNSSDYNPEEKEKNHEGPRRLFTKEEKALLNKRIPNLADATSTIWLPLHTLVASGEFYLVDKLHKHNVDFNATDKDGLTALHRAIICKKQAVTNYLLRESANPFVRDKDGATLMHYAVVSASSPAIKLLLLYNVDINLSDDDGWTPLHLAVQTQRTDVVRLLLIKGADKTLKNQDGLTPLDLCLYSGRSVRTYELIKLLKVLPNPQ